MMMMKKQKQKQKQKQKKMTKKMMMVVNQRAISLPENDQICTCRGPNNGRKGRGYASDRY
jgi:hypothetical protein